MTPHAFARDIKAALAPHADAERALAMRAYMRHPFDFIGVPTPLRRQAVAPLFKQLPVQNAEHLLACANRLWTMPAREYQYVATDLLARNWKTLAVTDIAHLLTIAQHASWWDSIDPLAAVVGVVIACIHDAMVVLADQLKRLGLAYEVAEVPARRQVQLFITDPAGNGVELNFEEA